MHWNLKNITKYQNLTKNLNNIATKTSNSTSMSRCIRLNFKKNTVFLNNENAFEINRYKIHHFLFIFFRYCEKRKMKNWNTKHQYLTKNLKYCKNKIKYIHTHVHQTELLQILLNFYKIWYFFLQCECIWNKLITNTSLLILTLIVRNARNLNITEKKQVI